MGPEGLHKSEVPQNTIEPPTLRGEERFNWKWYLLPTAGGLISVGLSLALESMDDPLWPLKAAIVTTAGVFAPFMIYNRIHSNTWWGKN